MKLVFQIVGVLGFIIMCICAFVIPNDPYEIIPEMTIMGFDNLYGSQLFLAVALCIY